jgi:hypothetical protein
MRSPVRWRRGGGVGDGTVDGGAAAWALPSLGSVPTAVGVLLCEMLSAEDLCSLAVASTALRVRCDCGAAVFAVSTVLRPTL